MLEIEQLDDGTVRLAGRLDAAEANRAQDFLDGIEGTCVIDMAGLDYISSAGLGVLLRTHKRLLGGGNGLTLTHVSSHISDIFAYSGFDKLFTILPAGSGSTASD